MLKYFFLGKNQLRGMMPVVSFLILTSPPVCFLPCADLAAVPDRRNVTDSVVEVVISVEGGSWPNPPLTGTSHSASAGHLQHTEIGRLR